MAMTWRTGVLFAGGLLLGAALGGWGVMQARDGAKWEDRVNTSSMGNAPAKQDAPAAAPAVAAAPQMIARCDTSAIVSKTREDGKETLQSAARAASEDEVSSLILTGKEAAASGRMRDAEVAFLNACRNAEVLQGEEGTLGVADAMYQLGRHYANVAATSERKQDLLARSQRLLTASLQVYRAQYGADHEKTKFAQQGLAGLQQVAGGRAPAAAPEPERQVAKVEPPKAQPAPVVQAPAPVPVPAPAPKVAEVRPPAPPAPAPAVKIEPPKTEAARPAEPARASQPAKPQRPSPRMLAESEAPKPAAPAPTAAAPAPAPVPAPATARTTRPSFDCSKARSAAEKIVCADEDLARQDRELAGLHKRAEGAASDRRAFRRQNDEEWSRRERECQDRECVQRWYSQRRAQLEESARAPQPAPARASTPETRSTEAVRSTATARPAPVERPAEPARVAEPVRRAPEPARVAEPVRREPAEIPVAPPTTSMGAPTAEGSPGDTNN